MRFCGVVSLAHLVHPWLRYRGPQEGTDPFHPLFPYKVDDICPYLSGLVL